MLAILIIILNLNSTVRPAQQVEAEVEVALKFEGELIQRELERELKTVFETNFLTREQLKFIVIRNE